MAEAVLEIDPAVDSVVDPFLGAGTSLASIMHHGVACFGQDVNPLAILISRTRLGPTFSKGIRERVRRVHSHARGDTSNALEADFPKRSKWFEEHVSRDLSRLRRAIRKEENLWTRRLFWVTMAETVRLTSNDRTSTYKLHARPKQEIAERRPDVLTVFRTTLDGNVREMQAFWRFLKEHQQLREQRYLNTVEITLEDSTKRLGSASDTLHDMLITSPPYGDNTSTVPYGQHSYLPLQWIDLHDIDPAVDPSLLRTTHQIDRESIGGRTTKRRALQNEAERLSSASTSLARTFEALLPKPPDRLARVLSFYRDLIPALDVMLSRLRANAYLIWTIGNRTVGGIEIPNDLILGELMDSRGAVHVGEVQRRIKFKRMASRNSIASTMGKERILIFRKTGAPDA